MQRLLSAVLSFTMAFCMLPRINACGEETEQAEIYAAGEAEIQEKYPKAADGHYLVVENYQDKIDRVPDGTLFGTYQDGQWTTQPILRYEDFPEMSAIEEAAKQGDYDAAKNELLEYHRKWYHEHLTEPETASASSIDLLTVRLMNGYNLFYSNSGVNLVNTFSLAPQEQEISVNIFLQRSDTIDLLRSVPAFELVALKKDGSEGSIVRSGACRPRLELMVNGEKVTLEAQAAGTIRAGSEKERAFPDEDRLYIRESTSSIKTVTTADTVIENYHEPLPIDENTERTLIKFDLSSIPEGQNITSAVLKFTGKTSAGSSRPYALFVSNNSMWTEQDLTWKSKEHYILVADKEPYGRYFLPWTEGFSRSYRDNVQRLYSILYFGYRAYLSTHDETYAYQTLTQICGFFDQLGNVETMAYTSTSMDSYETSRYGRNSLDVGARVRRLNNEFWAFIDSEHMTAEIWTSFVKYLWRTGDCLYQDVNYHPSNNWGAIETVGLYSTSIYMEEFRQSEMWMDRVRQRMYVADQVGDDMASIEVPLFYAANTTLKSLYQYQTFSEKIGKDFAYSPEVEKQITSLYKYVAYASGPGFVSLQMGDDEAHDYNVVKQFGTNIAKRFPQPEIIWVASNRKGGTAPRFTSHRYLSNRNYIMRTGWGDNDLFLETNMNGGYRNHAHEDDMGIIAYAYGQYLLADCGFDNLNYGTESNTWLASSRAHNTVEVNRKTQIKDTTLGTENVWVTNDSYDFFNGTTTRNADAKHTRSILFVRDGYWIVSDFMRPNNKSENQYVQIWHSQPNAKLSLDDATGAARTNFDEANIQIVPVGAESYDKSVIANGFYSEAKGKLTRADYVEYEQNAAGNVRFSTVLVPENTGVRKQISTRNIALPDVTDEGAAAMRLTISDKTDVTDATYYIVDDLNQAAERTVGEYKTNAVMMYVEKKGGALSKIYVQNAEGTADKTRVAQGDMVLLKSENALPQISVEYNGGQIEISTGYDANQVENTVTYHDEDLSTLAIYAPQYTGRVLLNNAEHEFYKKDGYLYLGKGVTDESKPQGGSGGGGGGGHGASGSAQNPANPINPTESQNPADPNAEAKEQLKQSVKGHWAQKELETLIENDIIQGTGGGLNLSGDVTRAEFAAMALRALGLKEQAYEANFIDVAEGDWYANIVSAAVSAGWLHGYEDKTFRPNAPITREEMAAVAAAVTGGAAEEDKTGFTDQGSFSDWSRPLISASAGRGLISGFPDGAFHPKDKTLREQAMVVIYRITEYMKGTEK